MPLIILGLLVLICMLTYAIVRYLSSGEEDTRSVRERYPSAFPHRSERTGGSGHQDEDASEHASDHNDTIHAEGYVDTDSLRGDIDYKLRNLKDYIKEKSEEHNIDPSAILEKLRGRGSDDSSDDDPDDNTVEFPTENIEEEKRRRNIH